MSVLTGTGGFWLKSPADRPQKWVPAPSVALQPVRVHLGPKSAHALRKLASWLFIFSAGGQTPLEVDPEDVTSLQA